MLNSQETKLLAYPNDPEAFGKIDVTNNLSEINKLLWKSWKVACDKKKPFILGYPYLLNPYYPILLYKTAKYLDKDIVFITDTKNMNYYLNQYELLAQDNGLFVFKFCIPILIKEGNAEIKLKPKMIPNKRKKEETDYLFGVAKIPDIRKIIFCDYMYLSSALEKNQGAIFPDIGKEAEISVDIGAVFFDNVDLITRNKSNLETFAQWTKRFTDAGTQVFIQTMNTYSPVIKLLEEKSAGLKLNYNHLLLKEFKNKFAKENISYDLLPKIIGNSTPETKKIEEIGNLDCLKGELDSIYGEIKRNKVKIPDAFKPIISLKELLLSLAIHPSDFKFVIVDEEGNWTTANIDRYIKILNHTLREEEFENKNLIEHYLSTFSTYYNELKETNRFGQLHQYNKDCKNSLILKILEDKKNSESDDIINFIVFTKTEKRILTKDIESLKLNFTTNILTFAEALKTEYIKGHTIISGLPRFKSDLVRLKHICENLKVLLYDGSQSNIAEKVISSIDEDKYLRKSKKDIVKLINENNIDVENLEVTKTIVNTKEDEKETENLEAINDDLEDPVTFESNITKYNITKSMNTSTSNDHEIVLQHIRTKEIISVNCGAKSKFISVNKDGEYSTVTYSELEVGEFLMKFGSDDTDDLLSIIAELYGIGDTVDVDMIRLWKSCFSEWVLKIRDELRDPSSTRELAPVTHVHKKYEEKCEELDVKAKTYVTFNGWVLEKRIGPDDIKDVLILGLLGDFPNIRREYKFIFEQMAQLRAAHVTVGKKISKIIRYLLSKQDNSNLNFQEQILYDRIQMFKILSKK